ncbi:MAG: DUF308 domain-containing protein [Desulfosarcina sp.]|nr:DUF308 domain-containing protein [Desulfobacterales bacterium]
MTNHNQEELKRLDSTLWKLIVVRGIALLLAGLILLFFSQGTLTVLIIIMGVYWLIDGIVTTFNSIKGRKVYAAWGWGIFTGVLGIIAGLVVLSQPVLSAILTTSFLVWFLGIAAIIYGISGLVTGIRLRKETKGEWTMILGGLFSIVFGIILITSPFVSVLVIIKTIGVIALIGGISILVVAFGIKKKAK